MIFTWETKHLSIKAGSGLPRRRRGHLGRQGGAPRTCGSVLTGTRGCRICCRNGTGGAVQCQNRSSWTFEISVVKPTENAKKLQKAGPGWSGLGRPRLGGFANGANRLENKPRGDRRFRGSGRSETENISLKIWEKIIEMYRSSSAQLSSAQDPYLYP